MAAKTDARMQAIQERAALMRRRSPDPPDAPPAQLPATSVDSTDASEAFASHFGIAALDAIVAGRSLQRLAIATIAPALDVATRQPRLLPPPNELLIDGQPNPMYADLVDELRVLGRSLADGQIQPIIVYRGTSAAFPAARYLILVGHRRWTAAALVGLDTLDAIVVDPPTAAERVRLQYVENEARVDFSDMERAWALAQLKRAMGDSPWEAVETQIGISRTRRTELTRLLAFSDGQQTRIARLRLRETQLRPLHQAVRDAALDAGKVDGLLDKLEQLRGSGTGEGGQRLDSATVAQLVTRTRTAQTPATDRTDAQIGRWAQALLDQLGRTKRTLRAARPRLGAASASESAQIRTAIGEIIAQLETTLQELPAEK